MLKKYWPVLIIALFLAGAGAYKASMTEDIEQINTAQLAELLEEDREGLYFVDVREAHEFEEGHINGMVNVPLSSLTDNYAAIPEDKKVVIICRSGSRSLQAANILKESGYSNITNVTGGMQQWSGEVIK
ncbi:rhodanese-like domain-containing protein [Evansella sp. LMS18]|uniref:rhodanese-like domain-containing protein n=1 Tax=Evansella sp. LMS18 TaxID=2924033 RepID=UPI0020D07577|nr:rhodanese-like domain-containing protein [Evansella sp. LMS18]UTR11551.1 rhodanese-like domain-containing protein [Evansella sp. LMS18]